MASTRRKVYLRFLPLRCKEQHAVHCCGPGHDLHCGSKRRPQLWQVWSLQTSKVRPSGSPCNRRSPTGRILPAAIHAPLAAAQASQLPLQAALPAQLLGQVHSAIELHILQVPMAKRLSPVCVRVPRDVQQTVQRLVQPTMCGRMFLPAWLGGAPKKLEQVHQSLHVPSKMSSKLKFPGLRIELPAQMRSKATEEMRP
nr:uncharacterized protein LOC129388086 [Dermacentor andersoni]